MKNKSLKTNKQGLTFIAKSLKMSLEQFLFFYTANDDFKKSVDVCIKDINSRRVPNGFEKLDVYSLLVDLVESK